jgi:hypothetical protein
MAPPKKLHAVMFLSLIAVLFLSALFSTQIYPANANPLPPPPDPEPITIGNDGTINPSTAPISKTGNSYTLAADLKNYSIIIECNNITFDGAGHTLQGLSQATGLAIHNATKVTIKNLKINQFSFGIAVTGAYNVITTNQICNCYQAIALKDYTASNLTITENAIMSNAFGVVINSDNNTICLNNFINNPGSSWQDAPNSGGNIGFGPFLNPLNSELYIGNLFHNGSVGNYYSDYKTKYPNATAIGNSGIGNTPYFIAPNAREPNTTTTDPYPLMAPYGNMPNPIPTVQVPHEDGFPTPTPTLPVKSPNENNMPAPTPSVHIDSLNEDPIVNYGFWILLLAIIVIIVGYTVATIRLRRKNRKPLAQASAS